MTIPIALFMGVYLRFLRPGKVIEVSIIGFILLLAAIIGGGAVAATEWGAEFFHLEPLTIAIGIVIYGFIAAILPVWLLLAPRDYLSTFMKIGTIVMLVVAIIIVRPELEVPAFTEFATTGEGPVVAGPLWPFLFVTIACGALSGFHALISSGTTPKLVEKERQTRFIGYGGMLMESFVAIMALVAALSIDQGIYFAMNSSAAATGGTVDGAVAFVNGLDLTGVEVDANALLQTAKDVGEESIVSRTGGAPTLAVGLAHIMQQLVGGTGMMAFWYHFAIMFEALFILTAVDAGTRSGRFMLQDLLGYFVPAMRRTEAWGPNVIATGGCVALWGYFLYVGVTDPLGGINMLWPLFGIANQMLAGIALMLCTVVLFKMKKDRYAWVPILPTVWLLACTLSAGWIKIFASDPAVGFLAQANRYRDALSAGELIPPSTGFGGMQQIMINNYVNAGLTALFMFVVLAVLFYSVGAVRKARANPARTDRETPYVALTEDQQRIWL